MAQKKIEPENIVNPHELGIFKQPRPHFGAGTVSYGLSISETENKIRFIIKANPKTTGNFEQKNRTKLILEYPFSQNSVLSLRNDLQKGFLDRFSDSENYFNKIEGLAGEQYRSYNAISVMNAEGIFMTKEYFKKIFESIEQEIEHTIEKAEASKKFSLCTLI